MITVDELRAQRDAVFGQQLAGVEASIDAAIRNLNLLGLRTYSWVSTTASEAQVLWLAERYRSLGYVAHIEKALDPADTTQTLVLDW